MEQGHYSRRKLDADVSQQLLQNYLETLDYRRLFFTQKDVDDLTAKYGGTLNDDILLGNSKPAVEIFEFYRKRVEDRIAKVKTWIETEKFDFTSDRSVLINRQKAPWPKSEEEADQLWHNWIEYEFLQRKLDEKASEPAQKVIERRYNQILKYLHEETPEDAVNKFLSCLAQTYDPHSEYFDAEELENFSINMKLKLIGIGAVLQSDEGYAKITELVTGGPAQKEGRLHVGDRICAVAQGDSEFVDTVDMKLDKVVRLIRGKQGSTVRLQAIPAEATDPSARKIVEIVRDEVKLKDKEAKAELIEKPDAKGHPIRLGWITLPSFYADMERSGEKGATSTTADVLALLNRLKKENIAGLVIDLRNNGGGSLEEAIRLTNLFVKKGPVVQAKNTNGRITVSRSKNNEVAYDGPLIVLTNTLSASASEIVAGALQDYGRAIIVGDRHTFGKGTVQTMLDIGRFMPFLGSSEGDAGGLKLTIQKFYRIAGGSTQLKGVASDIVLPSIYDQDDIGEKALKNPMPYDEVEKADFEKVGDQPLFLEQLRQRSTARVNSDPEFKIVLENLERLKKRITENHVSLNEKVRREEIAKDKARRKAVLAARAKRKHPALKEYALTLDNIDKPQLELVKNDAPKVADKADKADQGKNKGKQDKNTADAVKKEATKEEPKTEPKEAAAQDTKKQEETPATTQTSSPSPEKILGLEDDIEDEFDLKGPKVDPVRAETLNILNDLIDLGKAQKTAASSATPVKK